jgi:hypothetical protein
MSEKDKGPVSTSGWDVLIRLIDKGRLGTFALISIFTIMMYVPFSRMSSADARGTVEKFIESFFKLPSEHTLTFLLMVALVVVFFWAQGKIRILQQEVKRLVPFRDAYLHHKRECLDLVRKGLADGTIKSADDLDKVTPTHDIQHRSSHFRLE